MKNPNTPGAAPGSIEPDGLPESLELSIAEIDSLENAIRSAREEECAEAVNELERADAQDPGTRHFVDSVKAQWLSEIRSAEAPEHARPSGAESLGTAGRTAILLKDGPVRPETTMGPALSFPIWLTAAAAAALALIGWYGTRDTAQPTPVYLGTGDERRQVVKTGPSTAPKVLPETVDFSIGVREYVTFRIEIHDVTKSPRVDDGVALEAITYEPRWTCPESDRRNLPAVFRLEVHREIEAPGTAPLWSRVYARQ